MRELLRKMVFVLLRPLGPSSANAFISREMAIEIARCFARKHGSELPSPVRSTLVKGVWSIRCGCEIPAPWIRICGKTGDVLDHWGFDPNTPRTAL